MKQQINFRHLVVSKKSLRDHQTKLFINHKFYLKLVTLSRVAWSLCDLDQSYTKEFRE